jgi:hypothetical protein
MKIKFFKEPKPSYGDLGFLDVAYYAIVCPFYIGATGLLAILTLFLSLKISILSGIAFLLFLRNLPQVEKMYESNY